MFTILIILMFMPSLIDFDKIDNFDYLKSIPIEVISFEIAKLLFFVFSIIYVLCNL